MPQIFPKSFNPLARIVVLGAPLLFGTAGVIGATFYRSSYATGVDEVNCVVGVSDEFSHANQGMSTDEAIAAVAEAAPLAQAAGISPTVTLSVAFGCPVSGEVPVRRGLADPAPSYGASRGSRRTCERSPPGKAPSSPEPR